MRLRQAALQRLNLIGCAAHPHPVGDVRRPEPLDQCLAGFVLQFLQAAGLDRQRQLLGDGTERRRRPGCT